MVTFLVIVHVLVCIALVMIVLLQTGKGADMGAAFGGSTQTVFGGAGPAPFLGKITTVAAVIFMLTSLSLAYFFSKSFWRLNCERCKYCCFSRRMQRLAIAKRQLPLQMRLRLLRRKLLLFRPGKTRLIKNLQQNSNAFATDSCMAF